MRPSRAHFYVYISPKYMVPHSEKNAHKIAKEISMQKKSAFPKMSTIPRKLYPKMMTPFKNVQHFNDKGFFDIINFNQPRL